MIAERLSLTRREAAGAPPKVVRIGLGNCGTSDVAAVLKGEKLKLEQFVRDEASLLELP